MHPVVTLLAWLLPPTAAAPLSSSLSHAALLASPDIQLIQDQPAESSGLRTVWLCGDSTMAPGGGHNGTEGWGQYLQYSLDSSRIRVNNSAYAGRSARTFTREGRFQAIISKVQPGDWVVIEFGHNDGRKCIIMISFILCDNMFLIKSCRSCRPRERREEQGRLFGQG